MPSPFPSYIPKETLGYPIRELLGRAPTKGTIGLEIEVEGFKLPKDDKELRPWWVYHKDGSLRGRDNAEYVLVKPISFGDVSKALDHLWSLYGKYKAELDESNRTSVHVHLNCQEFYLNRLASFVALYTCFEELLTEWCGDHRVGNLFCLRAKDAPGSLQRVKQFICSDGGAELYDSLHYSGLNTHALAKFGSIEIRSLRGCMDKETILDWVGILEKIYNASENYTDPRGICDLFSQGGPVTFFETILGEHSMTIRKGIGWSEEQVRNSLYEGIRLAQDVCYCRDWDLYKPIHVTPDPFGRRVKAPKTINTFGMATVGGASLYAEVSVGFQGLGPLNQPAEESQDPEEEYDYDSDEDI